MEIKKKDKAPPHLVVRANRVSFKSKTKKSLKKRFNKHLLPSVLEFYMKELKKFHPRNSQQAMALCPFHDDHNPSFSIKLKTGAFYCFGCGNSGGDIIDFFRKKHNVSFIDACKALGTWHE